MDDFDYPYKKEFLDWKKNREIEYPVSDGFDLAYFQGIEVIEKELNAWDGGISENFIRGIEHAIKEVKRLSTGS